MSATEQFFPDRGVTPDCHRVPGDDEAPKTYSFDDPASIAEDEQTFGSEAVALLLAIQARCAADAATLQQRVQEIEADPDHPERASLWSHQMRALGAQQHLRSQRRLEATCRLVRRTDASVARPSVQRTPHRAGRSAVHGASRRASARSGDSGEDPGGDEPEGPEPSGRSAGRLCACGCGAGLDGRRADALTFGPACRKRLSRRERELASVNASRQEAPASERMDLATVWNDHLAEIFALMVTDAHGHSRLNPRPLRYESDRLRTRMVPVGAKPPAELRQCAECGCYLRRGRNGPVCEPCATGDRVAA